MGKQILKVEGYTVIFLGENGNEDMEYFDNFVEAENFAKSQEWSMLEKRNADGNPNCAFGIIDYENGERVRHL